MNSEERYYSVRIINAYAQFVKSRYLGLGLEAAYEYAGILPSDLSDLSHWLTQSQVNRFYEKAVEITANPNLARDAGRFVASSETVGAARAVTLAMMGPGSAYKIIEYLTARFSRAVKVQSRRLGRRRYEMLFTPLPEVEMQAFQCENTKGSLESISLAFDVHARLEHPECLFKGGACCRYVLEWDRVPYENAFRARNLIAGTLAAALAALSVFSPDFEMLPLLLGAVVIVAGLSLRAHQLIGFEYRRVLEKIRSESEMAIEEAQNRYNSAMVINEIGNTLNQQTGRILALSGSPGYSPGYSMNVQVDSLIHDILGVLKRHLGFDRAAFFLINEGGDLLFRAGYGFTNEEERRARFRPITLSAEDGSADPLVRCCRDGKPGVANDSGGGANGCSGHSGLLGEWGCRVFAVCPVISENQVIGVLFADNTRCGRPMLASSVSLLSGIAPAVAITVRNVRLAETAAQLTRLELEQTALRKEREVTRALQTLLLPKSSSFREKDFVLDAYYEPAAHSGGDWWWHEQLTNGRHRVVVGDVTGHGIGSAMMTAILAGAYRAVRVSHERDLELNELLPLLNRTVVQMCGETHGIAFLAIDFDLENDRLHACGAGLPPFFLENIDGKLTACSPATGSLGVESPSFHIEEHRFGAGDRLLLCTDGALEAAGSRLLEAMSRTRTLDSTARVGQLVNELRAARSGEGKPFEDDVTVIHIERPLGNPSALAASP